MKFDLDRRSFLLSSGAAGLLGAWKRAFAAFQSPFDRRVVSVVDFGAQSDPNADATRAIQAAIDAVERGGGGTIIIPARYWCSNIIISRGNVRLQGQGGQLVNARLTIRPEASNIEIVDLRLLDNRGDKLTYLMDVSGRDCRFTNLELVRDPIVGGVTMYVRQPSARCHFDGLRLRGHNATMIGGTGHIIENFDLDAGASQLGGGDDAFAIKGMEGATDGITIRNGIVRGYAAIVSFGSEIGTHRPNGGAGAVRNVTVENVTGDRCTRLAFFKPGALDYDWRNGVVEHITLQNLTLNDPAGSQFRAGIDMIAGRGATIRDVQASGITIVARAMDQGVASTAAINMSLAAAGAPATIENVRLQVKFTDPYAGAPHGEGAPGYPVDQIVKIEKRKGAAGTIAGIVLDVEGRGSSYGGIFVGPDLDGAVTVERAVLSRVATNPPSKRGGGGIWSNSRLKLGDVRIDSVKLPKFGGSAFGTPHD